MPSHFTPEHFFEAIRRDLPDQKFEFVQPIDAVILGPCSVSPGLTHEMPTVECPFGMTAPTMRGSEIVVPSRSWLHAVMEQFPGAKRALLISECCGEYLDFHQEIVRQSIPSVEWVIPDVPDFYTHLFFDRPDLTEKLVKSLTARNILVAQ